MVKETWEKTMAKAFATKPPTKTAFYREVLRRRSIADTRRARETYWRTISNYYNKGFDYDATTRLPNNLQNRQGQLFTYDPKAGNNHARQFGNEVP
jgi:hypothetical protein